jgi:hypothetical protein
VESTVKSGYLCSLHAWANGTATTNESRYFYAEAFSFIAKITTTDSQIEQEKRRNGGMQNAVRWRPDESTGRSLVAVLRSSVPLVQFFLSAKGPWTIGTGEIVCDESLHGLLKSFRRLAMRRDWSE